MGSCAESSWKSTFLLLTFTQNRRHFDSQSQLDRRGSQHGLCPQIYCHPCPTTSISTLIHLVGDGFGEVKPLLECWEKQSLFMKFRIAYTMRGYTFQLRHLTGAVPDMVVHGRMCGILFDDSEQGPSDSSTRFRQWCETVAQGHRWLGLHCWI
ncbi:hypothetical protein BV22DRAFT_1029803 [Leucogyrophana mollusca]|uniref:Uncharacterized protein n=1 Tax=Leucogyrophana mollusca TaxID=85980 RepID=A0ACB8BTC0_9AGAM|nr:hypothetical protein BV22DRAFT_1029803 [Leucogyrophana mollusca]